MPLDDLVGVIETLQQRIREHGPTLRANETRTRTALIDPMLTALGWDTADPTLVTPEYRVDVGWADYALQGPGNKPAAVIEAKRLGSIVENHLEQAVGYCIQQGITYAGITDGSHWQLYRTFDPVPMVEKLVLDVRIDNTPAHECALQLLLLWRPNVASGKAIPAKEPILRENEESLGPDPPPLLSPSLDARWVALSEYNLPGRTPPPTSIQFSDGTERPISQWYEVLTYTVEWLYAKGQLTVENVPVESNPTRYAVNTEPIHPNGAPFDMPKTVDGTPFMVSTNLNAQQFRRRTRVILEHCGVSPDTVQLQMGE